MRPPVLDALKEATQSLHEAIEANPFGSAIMDGTIDRERYVEMLRRFRGFHAEVEPRLAAALGPWAEEIGFDQRRRLEKIHQDLRALGTDTLEPAHAGPLPPLANPSQAFGVLYVLEGSTLGGKVVLRQLMQTLPVTPEQGGAYFDGYGDQNGPMWRAFWEVLDRFMQAEGDLDEAICAAQETFRALGTWLDAPSLAPVR